MLTRPEAETLGWTFTIDGEDGEAVKPGAVTLAEDKSLVRAPDRGLQVASAIPLFMLLREVSELEGQPLAEPITPELVAKMSGETYLPEPPGKATVAVATVEDRVAAALEQLEQAPPGTPVTADQLVSVVRALKGE